MTSPDFSEYVDLTINDVQPPAIYAGAVNYARTVLPEFQPRQGTVEDALLQAMSFVAGQVTGAINRLPNGLMEGLLRLFGFEREESSFATGSVVFTAIDSSGVIIPAGTRVSFTEISDTESIQHVFATDDQVVISAGNTVSAAVPITAVLPGPKPSIINNDAMTLLTASNRLLSAAFSGALSQGEESETDAEYFARGATFLASLSQGLTTGEQITNYVLTSYSSVTRAKTFDLSKISVADGVQLYESGSGASVGASLSVDPATGISPVPQVGDIIRIYGVSDSKFNGLFPVVALGTNVIFIPNTSIGASVGESLTDSYVIEVLQPLEQSVDYPGYAVTVVSNAAGQAVNESEVSTIKTNVSAKTIAGLIYQVTNAPILAVTVSVTIKVLSDYDQLAVRDAVDIAISDYISPDYWDWSTRIRRNSVLSRASQVEGVDYVDDVVITLAAGEILASKDNITGDIVFNISGVLPSSTVTVGAI